MRPTVIHRNKKIISLETNKYRYVASIAERLEKIAKLLEPSVPSVEVNTQLCDRIVTKCIDALDQYCSGVNTPTNDVIASHLICWITRLSPIKMPGTATVDNFSLDCSTINGYFAFRTGLGILGIDLKDVIAEEPAFIDHHLPFITPNNRKRIENQIIFLNSSVQALCDHYDVGDKCSF